MRKAEARAEPGPGCSIALRLERPLLSPIRRFARSPTRLSPSTTLTFSLCSSASRLSRHSVAKAEMEGMLSGLRHLTRNHAYWKPYRGFKSHPVRHDDRHLCKFSRCI